jgi:membrane-associated phospholipid phosphatase
MRSQRRDNSGVAPKETEQRAFDRRLFFKGAATVAAVAGFGSVVPGSLTEEAGAQILPPLLPSSGNTQGANLGPLPQPLRATTADQIKTTNSQVQLLKPIPAHTNNGDEINLPNYVGNYHKGLPTINQFGEVDPSSYQTMLNALSSGHAADYELIPLGGNARLTNPQAGLAFDTQGVDDQQIFEPPSPTTAGAERAAEAVENYWMALARDIPFPQYGSEPITAAAISELSTLNSYKAPKPVTGKNLFRLGIGDPNFQGSGAFSDTIGPYISQFLLVPRNLGAHRYGAEIITFRSRANGGVDYLTDAASWLAAQRGNLNSNDAANLDPTPRFVRSGRDLCRWVHVDLLVQAYLEAVLVLGGAGAPLSPANPYNSSRTQIGFGTLGMPFIQSLFAEVGRRALQAQWYQKWQVHRALRPEAFCGLVQFQITHGRYPFLNPQVVSSQAVQRVFSQNGTYFLPMAFPEGCPTHPSYGSGHATVAGACVTILKAMFDEATPIINLFQPVVPTTDGLSLVPYAGADAGLMTVGGELHKVAMNIAVGRNIAGVHWHSDAVQSLFVGEQVAISVLEDVKNTLNEFRTGGGSFTFHDFRGNQVTI